MYETDKSSWHFIQDVRKFSVRSKAQRVAETPLSRLSVDSSGLPK